MRLFEHYPQNDDNRLYHPTLGISYTTNFGLGKTRPINLYRSAKVIFAPTHQTDCEDGIGCLPRQVLRTICSNLSPSDNSERHHL